MVTSHNKESGNTMHTLSNPDLKAGSSAGKYSQVISSYEEPQVAGDTALHGLRGGSSK